MIPVQEPFDLPFGEEIFGRVEKLKGFVGIMTTWGNNGAHAISEVLIQRPRQLGGAFLDKFTLVKAIGMTQNSENMR